MNEQTTCPHCQKEIKDGTFKSIRIVDGIEAEFVREMLSEKSPVFCTSCYKDLFIDAKYKYDEIVDKLSQYIKKNIRYIPIVTTHTPHGWEYKTGSIVTGQSVTGTGVVSEFKSDISDFLGGQSGSFNKKLANGEKRCFNQLRAKALKQNANAIIATDIDYGDVGTAKGMLMVCAAGTAVRVTNLEIFGEKREIIEELAEKSKELERLNKYMSI